MVIVPSTLRLLHVQREHTPLARQSPQAKGSSYQQLEFKPHYTELRTKVMVTSSILRKKLYELFWKLDVESILDIKHKTYLLIF